MLSVFLRGAYASAIQPHCGGIGLVKACKVFARRDAIQILIATGDAVVAAAIDDETKEPSVHLRVLLESNVSSSALGHVAGAPQRQRALCSGDGQVLPGLALLFEVLRTGSTLGSFGELER